MNQVPVASRPSLFRSASSQVAAALTVLVATTAGAFAQTTSSLPIEFDDLGVDVADLASGILIPAFAVFIAWLGFRWVMKAINMAS